MNLSFKAKTKLSKDKNCLGLDVGTSTIKIVKLKLLDEGVQLVSLSLEPAQADLKPIIESLGTKCINMSSSGPGAIIRYVNFPKMNIAELRQALKFEAQKYIPFPIAEINLDSYILRDDLPDNKMLVLLAAAKKEFVNQRLKLLENTSSKVNIIDIDSIALVNAFNFNYSQEETVLNKTVALLNIGSSFSNLNILESGMPRLSRDIHIAGNNITQRIADNLGIEQKAAEELKINPDKERLERVVAAGEFIFSSLASELRTSFDYYESQGSSTVGRIFLSGGGSLFMGAKDILANLLGIEIVCWDPFKNISLPEDIDFEKRKVSPSQLAVAVGLALHP